MLAALIVYLTKQKGYRMNSLQSFSLIVGGVFLLPILALLVGKAFLTSIARDVGGFLIALLVVSAPFLYLYMIGRLIYLKILS